MPFAINKRHIQGLLLEKEIDDFRLLNGKRVQVDVLESLDLLV